MWRQHRPRTAVRPTGDRSSAFPGPAGETLIQPFPWRPSWPYTCCRSLAIATGAGPQSHGSDREPTWPVVDESSVHPGTNMQRLHSASARDTRVPARVCGATFTALSSSVATTSDKAGRSLAGTKETRPCPRPPHQPRRLAATLVRAHCRARGAASPHGEGARIGVSPMATLEGGVKHVRRQRPRTWSTPGGLSTASCPLRFRGQFSMSPEGPFFMSLDTTPGSGV